MMGMREHKDCKKFEECGFRKELHGCPNNCVHFRHKDEIRVVRCKDCVHMKKQFGARFCNVWCMYNGMGDGGFCNYGERKENGK